MPALPAINTLWFWFDKKTRRDLHGTPEDVLRKFDILNQASCLDNGIEIFLMPSKLPTAKPFKDSDYNRLSKLPYISVHIGEADIDFLDKSSTEESLLMTGEICTKLKADALIIHAHHFRENTQKKIERLKSYLQHVDILIENNGFDNEWGATAANVRGILEQDPGLQFCMDIAHINDFPHIKLEDFSLDPVIQSRVKEIHASYSTHLLPQDPYEAKGFSGYGPFHALFSVLGKEPSRKTREFINGFPVVIEGIVPKEDKKLYYLKKENDIITRN